MHINKISKKLNTVLKIKKYQDYSKNGLQVKACTIINKIGFAVDACIDTFLLAKKHNVDLLIVHHGIIWKEEKKDEIFHKRVKFLRDNNISLYAAHLPLDLHPKYGNNIQLCNLLKLEKVNKFGKHGRINVGYSGEFKKAISIHNLVKILNNELDTKCNVLNFGKNKIKTIGIVSGGGSFAFTESLKFDCLLIGETTYKYYNLAKDCKQNVILAGHYATETIGVKALMDLFDIECIFLDNKVNM